MDNDKIREQILDLAKQFAENLPERTFGYIPPSGKVLGANELVNMVQASLDMWLTAGRFNDQFESEFAKTSGRKYAISANSGSSANLLALSTLTSHKLGDRALKKGDEVITVAAGFPTTVNPIFQNGLVPVFVDNELKSYNIDADKIEEALSPKTKAVFVAHTLGNPFDLKKIADICKKHKLWLIEDTCDALGAEYEGKKVGTFGDLATYSFYPAHHITMGEGGAVSTDNALLHRIATSFRDWGRDCWCPPGKDNTCKNRFNMKLGKLPAGYDHKYTYSHIGYNLKITDWQAAIGLAQLKRLPEFIEKRTKNAQFLLGELADLKDVLVLPEFEACAKPSWFGFLISVRESAPFKKSELVEFIEQKGIGTRQLFAGNILRQPMITESDCVFRIGNSPLMHAKDLSEDTYKKLPNAEFIMNNSFWIGCFPALGESELLRSAAAIREFCRR